MNHTRRHQHHVFGVLITPATQKSAYKHWEYQSFCLTHLQPEAQLVAPE